MPGTPGGGSVGGLLPPGSSRATRQVPMLRMPWEAKQRGWHPRWRYLRVSPSRSGLNVQAPGPEGRAVCEDRVGRAHSGAWRPNALALCVGARGSTSALPERVQPQGLLWTSDEVGKVTPVASAAASATDGVWVRAP